LLVGPGLAYRQGRRPSGTVVPGPGCARTNVATGAAYRTLTTTDGSYTLPGLQPGDYTSTAECNEDRIRHHLLSEYSQRELGSIDRDELQTLLDGKAQQGLSFSTVDHLRRDLKQIFNIAVVEG
jgi:hypothetical protein